MNFLKNYLYLSICTLSLLSCSIDEDIAMEEVNPSAENIQDETTIPNIVSSDDAGKKLFNDIDIYDIDKCEHRTTAAYYPPDLKNDPNWEEKVKRAKTAFLEKHNPKPEGIKYRNVTIFVQPICQNYISPKEFEGVFREKRAYNDELGTSLIQRAGYYELWKVRYKPELGTPQNGTREDSLIELNLEEEE